MEFDQVFCAAGTDCSDCGSCGPAEPECTDDDEALVTLHIDDRITSCETALQILKEGGVLCSTDLGTLDPSKFSASPNPGNPDSWDTDAAMGAFERHEAQRRLLRIMP